METKTSKAQLEVWEWKEKAYNLIKDLPKEKQIPFIIESTKETVELLKERKRKKLKVNK
ncbi:MAG: hypothetical protein ABI840_04770 [bacterium]